MKKLKKRNDNQCINIHPWFAWQPAMSETSRYRKKWNACWLIRSEYLTVSCNNYVRVLRFGTVWRNITLSAISQVKATDVFALSKKAKRTFWLVTLKCVKEEKAQWGFPSFFQTLLNEKTNQQKKLHGVPSFFSWAIWKHDNLL